MVSPIPLSSTGVGTTVVTSKVRLHRPCPFVNKEDPEVQISCRYLQRSDRFTSDVVVS